MTCSYSDINQHDALYKVVREYPGGLEALAQRMRKTVPVMYNKFRPSISTHNVSFEEVTEAVELCAAAGVADAMLPIHAMAWRLGHVLIAVPNVAGVANEELTQRVCKAVKEFGDVASCLYKALESNKDITPQELEDFEREFQQATSAMFELRASVQEMSKRGGA